MPAGPSEMGLVYFAATKFVGYTAFCRWAIEPQIEKSVGELPPIPAAWKAGIARTLIGVSIGAVVGLGFWNIPWLAQQDVSEIVFFSLLIPVRIFEWGLLLRWIYRNYSFSVAQQGGLITGGIVTSFALDALGITFAFVLPGGMWVC